MRPPPRQIGTENAVIGDGIVYDPVTDEYGPSPVITGLVSTGGTVGIVDLGDGTRDLSALGGGGAGWDHPVSLPLTTLTGWTAGAGAWSVSAAGIRQATTAAAVYRLRYTAAKLRLASAVVDAEMKMDAASGANSRVGVVFGAGWASDVTGGLLTAVIVNAGFTLLTAGNWEYDAILAGPQEALAATIPFGTWFDFRAVKYGSDVDLFVNGVFVGTGHITQTANRMQGTLALYAYGADVSFRNLDVWTPTQP